MDTCRCRPIQLVMVVLVGIVLVACSAPTEPPPQPTPVEPRIAAAPEPIPPKASAPRAPVTTEHYLAMMERGKDSPPGDPLAAQFERQLDALAEKCLEDRKQLAVYLVGIHDLMARRGVRESRLSIITQVTRLVPDDEPRPQCDEFFVAHYNARMKSVGLGGGPRASR